MELRFLAETGRGQEAEPAVAPQLDRAGERCSGFAYLMIERPAAVVVGFFAQCNRVLRGTGREEALRAEPTRENIIAGQVLAECRELAVAAARIAPPAYITKELGERPADPEKRRSWEAGVRTIEGYRQEHGVKDRDHTFGQDTGRSAERAREQAHQRLRQSQRELGRIKEAARTHDMDFSLGTGR